MRRPPTSATTIFLSITPISCRCTCDPSVMGHHFLAVRVSVNNVTTSVGWSAYWIHFFVMARIGNCVSRVLTYIVQFHYSFVSFSPFTDSEISELESGDSSLDTAGKFIFTMLQCLQCLLVSVTFTSVYAFRTTRTRTGVRKWRCHWWRSCERWHFFEHCR